MSWNEAADEVLAELKRINAMPGSDERTDALRAVTPRVLEFYKLMTDIRKQEIARLAEEKKLTIRELAVRVGASPAAVGFQTKGKVTKDVRASDS